MERALLVGGVTTATGLYVGAIAARRGYDLLSRGLDYLTQRYTAPWIESEPRIAVPAALTTMLLARDEPGGAMLLTHTGVFYLAAPSYDLYEFCAPMPGPNKTNKVHIRLSVDAFLLYHSALACLYHQPSYAMLLVELQTRTNAFVADALLHMLSNDVARLLASKKTQPPALTAAIGSLLRTLCDHQRMEVAPRPSMWRRLMTYMLGADNDAPVADTKAHQTCSLDLLRAFFFSTADVSELFRQTMAAPPNGSYHYYYAPHADTASTLQRLGAVLRHTDLPRLVVFVEWAPAGASFEHDNARHTLVNDVALRVGRLRYGFLSS